MWNPYKKLCDVKGSIDKVEITISYLTDAKILKINSSHSLEKEKYMKIKSKK